MPLKLESLQKNTFSTPLLCYLNWLPTLISFGCRFPIFSTNNWQTHLSFFINIGVIYFGFKINFWWFKWIFCWEINFYFKCSFVVGWTILKKTVVEDKKTKSGDQIDLLEQSNLAMSVCLFRLLECLERTLSLSF